MVERDDQETDREQAPRRRRSFRPLSARRASAPQQAPQLPPAPLPAPEDGRGDLLDDADEQGEQDVIVPAGPASTEPADSAEPADARRVDDGSGDGPSEVRQPAPDGPSVQEPAPTAERTPEPEPERATEPEPERESAPEADREPAPARPPLAVLFQAPPTRLPPVLPSASALEEEDEEPTEEAEEEPGSRRRRRTRKRSGTARTDEPGSTTEVVQRTRPPREQITEPQRLKGSTRLEAKRQRRRDGRDAGRRRTVVTESEFLARREAVDRVMLVRAVEDRTEIGVLEDGVLAEHYVAKHQNVSLIGNVYLGRVQNVLPSMEAAFVDIGRGRNAVLYSGEVDWEAAGGRLGDKGSQARRIELALKPGDQVLVQVTKDPIGHKGARLTSAISLPGRYLVYVPNGSMSGISRKLPDTERARLKKILKDALPDSAGVIVRTAAEGATEEQLTVDVQRLANQWAEIEHLIETAQAPAMLHGEPDLLVKIVRDVFNEDFSKLVVDGEEPRATIERYLQQVAPDLIDRLGRWEGDGDVFSAHRVVEQIEKALDRKVWLPSGGSLVIDRTEAMTVVDVNTGKFVGSGGNLEETVTKNNLEAAEEIVRQLRLRDIGGIIVIDFIDMVLETNRDLVQRRLVECLSRDRTKHQVAEVTSLGLVQMTRKRLGIGLAESVGDAPAPEPRQEQGRRRRGGGQASQPPVPPKAAATHTITDGAKTALAQIAASTIVPAAVPARGVADEPAGVAADPAAVVPPPAVPEPVEERAQVLDLPIGEQAARPRLAEPEAEHLLDSVLESLPAPRAAGQGRRRSRRVSTPTLTAGED